MKVSLEWISDFVTLPETVTPSQLAHELTLKTVEVEDVVKVDDDYILEIDNKSLTNRPDLWGHYGIARELAAIFDVPLEPLPTTARPPVVKSLIGSVDPALCTRFAAVEFGVDSAAPTPPLIRARLARIGEASVSLCVDLSNYVMFTVGQPTHVYDFDRVALPLSAELNVGEPEIELLTGVKVRLPRAAPVIRDGKGIVGAAGVMGSAASAVTASSQHFLLEAASFRPRLIRHLSQQLGLRTEASARYEKGLDTQRVDQAVDLFLHLLERAVPDAAIIGQHDVQTEPTVAAEITVTREFLDRRIGQVLEDAEVEGTLGRLGFSTEIDGGRLRITPPSWRSTGDVSLPHDIVEEVARIHGYDRLDIARTTVTLEPVRSRNNRQLDRLVREQLAARGGLQEVVTYPWTTDYLLEAAGICKSDTVRFEGAPAPDRDALRPSLLPNLLETVAGNLRYQSAFGVFEVGTVFGGGPEVPYRQMYETMPPMPNMLGIALVGSDGVELFRRAKGLLGMMRRHCHIIELSLLGDSGASWADRSARIAITAGGAQVGTLALLTPKSRRLAGIEAVHVAYAELDLGKLTVYQSRENRFSPVPDLPEADFDLSVVVADEVSWATIESTARGAHPLVSGVSFVDEFRGSWVPAGSRSVSLRITLRPREATLTSGVIGAARSAVLDVLGRELDAHLR